LHTRQWESQTNLASSHMIVCARCKRRSSEAGFIEAFTTRGEGAWAVCHGCLSVFIDYIFMVDGGVNMNDVVITYGVNDDIDVSEHHLYCQCIECRIFDAQYDDGFDADDAVKFMKENNDDRYVQERRSA